MTGPTATPAVGTVVGVDLVRTTPPVDRLGEVLDLLDELAELGRAVDGLTRQVETATGLRSGELQVLAAVSEGAAHPRSIARRTGQVVGAAAVTVDVLARRGLLRRLPHPAAPGAGSALVALTAAGRGVLAQVQGLRIHALAAVVQDLGDDAAAGLGGTVRALGAALGSPVDATPAVARTHRPHRLGA